MDQMGFNRRDFLRLAGLGSVVFASGLSGCVSVGATGSDFHFIQISDVHWGYGNPKVNPEHRSALRKAVGAVNALEQRPDFVVFTGDLTQSTDDPKVRRQRLREFREQAAELRVPKLVFFPGEHDASLDRAEAYREVIGGDTFYAFDHKGLHFIVLDNTSDPAPILGDGQLQWLGRHLAERDRRAPIVVLTHWPLFPLHPQWDWNTRDGVRALDMLSVFDHVTVFYGHIHHEHHHRTGRIEHHAAMSPMFPLSPVGTAPQKTQLPWDASRPHQGLGYREVLASGTNRSGSYAVRERPFFAG